MRLKIHDRNYPTNDLELAVIVFLSLKIWSHYPFGIYMGVFIDH